MNSTFVTYFIVSPVCFFLGIIFTNWAFDHSVLWDNQGATFEALAAAESHYRALYNAPTVMRNTFYSVVLVGLVGLIVKLYRPNESNTLFDGGSLVLYMVAVIMYGTNMRTGLAAANAGKYGDVSQKNSFQILAATQVITALVLIGVLLLQGGQFYAERLQRKEMARIELEEEQEKVQREKGREHKKHR